MAARLDRKNYRVYTVIGDGESCEGSIWEAAMSAAHYKLDNLICFLDRNRLMIDGPTEEIMSLEPLADKWTAFGFETSEIDGHDLGVLAENIEWAQTVQGKPVMLVCDTVKGKGVSFMENDPFWHGNAPDAVQTAQALQEISAAAGLEDNDAN